MARESRQVTVAGTLFEIVALPATQGMKVQARLAQLVGPMIGVLAAASQGSSFATVAGDLVGKFFANLSDENLDYLRTTFSKVTRVRQGDMWLDLNDGVFDEVFSSKYTEVYLWVWEHVKLNRFEDFLSGLRGALAAASPAAPTKSR